MDPPLYMWLVDLFIDREQVPVVEGNKILSGRICHTIGTPEVIDLARFIF